MLKKWRTQRAARDHAKIWCTSCKCLRSTMLKLPQVKTVAMISPGPIKIERARQIDKKSIRGDCDP